MQVQPISSSAGSFSGGPSEDVQIVERSKKSPDFSEITWLNVFSHLSCSDVSLRTVACMLSVSKSCNTALKKFLASPNGILFRAGNRLDSPMFIVKQGQGSQTQDISVNRNCHTELIEELSKTRSDQFKRELRITVLGSTTVFKEIFRLFKKQNMTTPEMLKQAWRDLSAIARNPVTGEKRNVFQQYEALERYICRFNPSHYLSDKGILNFCNFTNSSDVRSDLEQGVNRLFEKAFTVVCDHMHSSPKHNRAREIIGEIDPQIRSKMFSIRLIFHRYLTVPHCFAVQRFQYARTAKEWYEKVGFQPQSMIQSKVFDSMPGYAYNTDFTDRLSFITVPCKAHMKATFFWLESTDAGNSPQNKLSLVFKKLFKKPSLFQEKFLKELDVYLEEQKLWQENMPFGWWFIGANIRENIHKFKLVKMFLNGSIPAARLREYANAINECRDPVRANSLLSEMEKKGCNPDLSIFNRLIQLHAFAAESQAKSNVEEIEKILSQMKRLNIKANLITYSYVIEAYAKRDDFNKVISVLEEMSERGIEPNVMICNCVMGFFARKGEYTQVIALFEQMLKKGIEANDVTYNCVIEAYTQKGMLSEAATLRAKHQALC